MNKYYVLALMIIAFAGALFSIIGLIKSNGLASKFRFFLILATTILSIFFVGLVAGFWNYIGLKKTADSVYQLIGILPLFLIAYCLMGLTTVTIAAYRKKGFHFIKTEKGLIAGLIRGLIGGFIIGMITGIAVWACDLGLFDKFDRGITLIEMLIVCPLVGLIGGYILGASLGYKNEFKP